MKQGESTTANSPARLSATVDPEVLAQAKTLAKLSGFSHSFSAYLNAVLQRDNKHRTELLNGKLSPSLIG